ncbi:MAG: LysR substrate-binding domain-containing protein [Devosia sp.]|nr:LysR substrate-binding domain-containing protein [Devosia sp.]
MHISLRQLRYAIALAQTGHFGRAAERVHVSQPALSQQIRLLEETCGGILFDRPGRSVRLTPFGQDIVDRARPIVEQADALLAFATAQAGKPARPLRFGLIPTVAPYLLPDIFPALQAALPELGFSVSEDRTDALIAALGDGSLDLALIASEPRPGGPRLTVAPLFADPFVLATAPGDRTQEPVQLGSIDTKRMLLLDEGHCFRDQAIAACSFEHSDVSRAFAATSLSTIVEFVANGQGITLLPEIALRKEATGARIGIHALAAPGAGRMLSLVWRGATPYAELFERVAEIIRDARPAIPAALRSTIHRLK